MQARFKGPYFFTQQQADGYNRTLGNLREVHGDAFRELRLIVLSNLTKKSYMQAGESLTSVASQINSGLQFIMEILCSAQKQPPLGVEFVVSGLCRNCTAPPEPPDDPGVKLPPLDPAHQAVLDDLLDLTQRVSQRLGSFSRRHKTIPTALTKGVKCVTDALIRERRHFRDTAAVPETELRFLVEGPPCCVCGRMPEVPPPDGWGRK